MKEVLIISGKGGTGKTTVSAALADLASKSHALVLVDADVDAANLELLLEPTHEETFPFRSAHVAVIDQDLCIQCGICEEVCRFDAVRRDENDTFRIDPSYCEGCLACLHACPSDAIQKMQHQNGEWYRSKTTYGTLFHANLYPGEENSGKLVSQIKTDAREFAEAKDVHFLLIDGPPGIGCPVTAACTGADLAVIVTEPTMTGFHDMRRVKAVAEHFRIPTQLVINKCDLNLSVQQEMLKYAAEEKMHVAGMIPYDEAIMHAQAEGKPVTQSLREPYFDLFQDLWLAIEKAIYE